MDYFVYVSSLFRQRQTRPSHVFVFVCVCVTDLCLRGSFPTLFPSPSLSLVCFFFFSCDAAGRRARQGSKMLSIKSSVQLEMPVSPGRCIRQHTSAYIWRMTYRSAACSRQCSDSWRKKLIILMNFLLLYPVTCFGSHCARGCSTRSMACWT